MLNEDKIELLVEMGEIAYGSHWKSELSALFGINDRSIRQWAAGERPIPDSFIRGMLSHLHDRAEHIHSKAQGFARILNYQKDYQRIICLNRYFYVDRPDLTGDTKWFDIDGKLYGRYDNGFIVSIRGDNADLPDGVTDADLMNALNDHINDPKNTTD
nr:hypothetical protein [uncultured Enterobacter sp.]